MGIVLRHLSLLAAGLAMLLAPTVARADLDSEGWTLRGAWEDAWSRIYQRFSRPDPDGPLLQQVLRPYRRYGLDIEVAEFPRWMENAWQASPHGVRFWAQSLDEFELANRAQLKAETPTWPGGFLAFHYDRYQTRTEDRELFRFSIGQRAAADQGPEAALTLFSGFVKDDLDVECTFRWRFPGLGTAGLRLAVLDPFINSSFALAESRGLVLPEHVNQRGVPLALSVEIASAAFHGLRGELYGGRIIPQEQDRRFPEDPAADHTRRLEAWLGAALLEYRLPGLPVRLGAAALLQEARMDWEYRDPAVTNRQVAETARTLHAWLLVRPHARLLLSAALRHLARPQTEKGPQAVWQDDESLLSLRAFWQATGLLGIDLAYYRLTRTSDAAFAEKVNGTFHRIVPRLSFQLGEKVWAALGVGWTWDMKDSAYDGGGITMVWVP